MSHYVETLCKEVAPASFESWWKTQRACYRDGCCSVRTYWSDYSGKNATEARTAAFIKKVGTDLKKKGEASQYASLDNPKGYTVVAYDVGTAGWRVSKKVNRIIHHKRKEVVEYKDYKKKPSHIPSGARCERLVQWVFSFDAREYDPLEHGESPYDYYG